MVRDVSDLQSIQGRYLPCAVDPISSRNHMELHTETFIPVATGKELMCFCSHSTEYPHAFVAIRKGVSP